MRMQTSGSFVWGAPCSTPCRSGTPSDALSRYFECWLLRLQGVYPSDLCVVAWRPRVYRGDPTGRPGRRRRSWCDAERAARTRAQASVAHHLAPGKGDPVGARDERDARVSGRSEAIALTLQDLILKLSSFWASRGCLDSTTAGPRSRRGHVASGNTLSRARSAPVERRVRAAVAAAGRWPVWSESEPPVQAPADAGDPQAGARRSAAALSRQPRSLRHQSAPARHSLRRGQLGIADARSLGHRLAGHARRPGDHAVHLLPAGAAASIWRRCPPS